MSNASSLLTFILVAALLVRVVLDFTSTRNPRPGFDIAYAVLFFVVGVAVLVDDTASMWGFAMLGLAAWSLFSFILKRKKGNLSHEK